MAMELIDRMGIQSYCFRAFKENEQVIQGLKDCGVDRIELCGVHLNPLEDDITACFDLYKKNDIAISSFGVHRFDTDEDQARKVFELAKLAGFPTISTDLAEGALPVVEKLCEEYGKRVAIHNHGKNHHLGSVAALESLFAKSSRNVGLCLDTAWMLQSGENPVAVARKFQDRLYGLHLKDFIFDAEGKHTDVIVGTGGLELAALVKLLNDCGFAGYLTQEYEGNVDDPVPALKECVTAIKTAFAQAS